MDNIISFLIKLITSFIDLIPAYFRKNQEFKKLQYLIDSDQLIQKNANEDFYEKFIKPTTQENLFLLMTGIDTHYKSINSYIELKNFLGENCTWKIIKTVKPYIKFDNANKIYIKLNKLDEWDAKLMLLLAFLSMLAIPLYAILSSLFKWNLLSTCVILIILFISTLVLFNLAAPILNADFIKKKLEKR